MNLRLVKELPAMRGGVQGGGERFRGSFPLARAQARLAEQPKVVGVVHARTGRRGEGEAAFDSAMPSSCWPAAASAHPRRIVAIATR